jgi:leader peptidase (prepilin peptidase) / N-methyltransferase
VTAVLFAAVAVDQGLSTELAIDLPFVAVLVAVAAIDLEHRIVPNKILVPAAVWAIGASALLRPEVLPELAIAGGSAFLVLLLAALAYPGGMGMGDVKLAGVMGLYLGSAVAVALLVAFLAGSVVGVLLMLRDGFQARKRGLPFAPFLVLGALVAMFAGPELVELYQGRFLA